MRLPPRQSTGESDLMVPFQLVCGYNLKKFHDKKFWSGQIVFCNALSFGNTQAATKTIAEEDKYFSRVSLRSVTHQILF